MSEAIIARRGSIKGSTAKTLKTEYIVLNTNWTVPDNAENNTFSIRIFGGGGGGFEWTGGQNAGGGGGWMNNEEYQLIPKSIIPISIGAGGNPGASWSWSWTGFGNPTATYGDYDNATNDRALYYYPNNRTCSIIGSTRLYYGEGASGSSIRNGNNGCCIVIYID